MKYKIFKKTGHVYELQPLPSNVDPTNLPIVEGQVYFMVMERSDASDWYRRDPTGAELCHWTNSKGEQYYVTTDE